MPRPDLQIINIEGASECSILVVEDQLENRLLLNGLLQAYGFTVANAENGRLALDQLEIKKPDLILLDRRMPVMDGLEMLAKLRARPACQEIPVIAVTAQAFEEEKQEMLAAGCQDFLAKPFRDSDLYALLAKHLPIRLVTAETQPPKPAPQLSTAVLLALPENLRLRLRNLVKIGNITQLAALVPEVEVHQPELAAMISLAVTSYDLCTLTELCASYPA
jgi:CheY-like chemotaxis protein